MKKDECSFYDTEAQNNSKVDYKTVSFHCDFFLGFVTLVILFYETFRFQRLKLEWPDY